VKWHSFAFEQIDKLKFDKSVASLVFVYIVHVAQLARSAVQCILALSDVLLCWM